MTSLQYLEFDSTYRNRVLWPLPSNFRINISQTGNKERFSAYDPISSSAPKKIFTGSFRNDINSDTVPIASVFLPVTFTSNSTIGIVAVIGSLRTDPNFYEGSIISLTTGAGNTANRRVETYEFLGNDGVNDRALITVDIPFPDILIQGGIIGNINNPSTINTTSSYVFIPGGIGIDNFYKGCTLYNLTLSESRTVIKYDSIREVAQLDSPAPTWNSFDSYIIRKVPPCNSGIVGVSTTTTITLDPLTSSFVDDFYVGGFIRIGLIPAALVPPFDSLPAPWNEVRRIVKYDGGSRIITVNPPFSVAPGAPNNTYDIECFTRDNMVPFNYTGSLVSQQQSVCYEVQLVNVILPNRVLCSGKGGLVAFYPYLYVGLESVSSSTMNSSTSIYSNNPNSTRKLFRVIVDDTSSPTISPFVNLDGDGMIQTIKFKPNNSFHFTVCHSDGEMFETVDEEHYGPSPPNLLIQISALFSIRRISNE